MKKFIFSCLAWLSILACSVSAQVGDGYTVFVTYADVGDGTTDVTIATTGLLVDIDSTQNQAIDFSSFSNAVTPNVSSQGGTIDLVSITVSTTAATLYTHTFDDVANDSTPALHTFSNGVGDPPASIDLMTGVITSTDMTTSAGGFSTSAPLDLSAETEFTVEFIVESNSSLIAAGRFNGAFFGITSSATSSATDGSALFNNAGSATGPAIGLQVGVERGVGVSSYVFDNLAGNIDTFIDLTNDFADDAVACVLGDVDMNGVVDFNDIPDFVTVLLGNMIFQCEADCDENGVVDFNDIPVFVEILLG